jgi:hypothetical protein
MPFEGMNRDFGVTNTPTMFTRYLRRMPDFEGFWFSYRTSSAETSFTQGNATSVRWLDRCDHGNFRQLLVSEQLARCAQPLSCRRGMTRLASAIGTFLT